MKAIVYEEFGGSEVMAIAVNSSDHRIRRGRLQPAPRAPAARARLHGSFIGRVV